MKKSIFVLLTIFSVFAAIGHSGRTDANGGHHDRKNGGYHYHGTPKSRSTPSTSSTSRVDFTATEEATPQRAVTQQVVARPVVVPTEAQKAEIEAKTIAWQEKQAAAGSASAQFDLGVRYFTGKGVEKNLERAIELLELAATAGHPQAQKKLDEALQEVVPLTVQPSIPGDLERLKKENDLLRKENQELRRLLAGGNAPNTLPVSTPAQAITPINNSVGSSPATPATSKWTISSTGKRHNSSCRYYGSDKPCGATEGVACKICGG